MIHFVPILSNIKILNRLVYCLDLSTFSHTFQTVYVLSHKLNLLKLTKEFYTCHETGPIQALYVRAFVLYGMH